MEVKRKVAVSVSIAAALVGISTGGAYAASKYLSVPVSMQAKSNWCWVASAQSVVK
ncbi:hypothetical protein [Nocardioides sp.]|uniref:hypothetical protein n=1 Tax=Nocardioides sp. TaxID=35761 RepID=UPI0039E6FBF2